MTSTLIRRATRVGIDPVTHADVFPATVLDGQQWNGWTCPTFDRATAERVAAWAERGDGADYNRFRWTTDRTGADVLLHGESDGGTAWWWGVAGDDASGYAIGSHGWTWSECEYLPADPAECDAALAAAAAATAEHCRVWNAALTAAYADGADAPAAVAAARAAVVAAGLDA